MRIVSYDIKPKRTLKIFPEMLEISKNGRQMSLQAQI
jgi:hypothetical protein